MLAATAHLADLKYDVFETALGWVAVVASKQGVRQTSLPEPSPEEARSAAGLSGGSSPALHEPAALKSVRDSIIRYCAGEPVDLSSVPVDMSGWPEFFQRARRACRGIPPGETRTYAWLAGEAGSPRAARGAGQAMARNPVPLLVPCHRVVGSDGGLHGFGGSVGLPLKQRLLNMESAAWSSRQIVHA